MTEFFQTKLLPKNLIEYTKQNISRGEQEENIKKFLQFLFHKEVPSEEIAKGSAIEPGMYSTSNVIKMHDLAIIEIHEKIFSLPHEYNAENKILKAIKKELGID